MRARRGLPCGALAAVLLLITPAASAAQSVRTLPVIDMHLHASRIRSELPVAICPGDQPLTFPAVDPKDPSDKAPLVNCERALLSAKTTQELRDGTITELKRHNVRRSVLAGTPELVDDWMVAAPHLFIPAAAGDVSQTSVVASLRRLHRSGKAAIFAEVGAQYSGIGADDPRLEPFWELAESLDVPVGIHLGEGMPGQSLGTADRYRAKLTSPFQLEELLIRHPRLRVYVMHAASPLTDEMIAMLFEYPRLHVDVAASNWNMPRAQFYDQLKRMVDAGFSKRIMFGSDQTIWPQAIGLAIRTIEEAPFLTPEQKRDILYNNAARFLRLTKQQIAQDHAQ